VRRAAKRDETEDAIKAALEADGWVVSRLSGEGIPDLLASKHGRWELFECKSSGGGLTAAQRDFIRDHKAPTWVVSSPVEALEVARRLADTVRPPVNAWDEAHEEQSKPQSIGGMR
jgi:hypothetical protein